MANAANMANIIMVKLNWRIALVIFCVLLVGLLYAAPQFLIKRAVESSGRTFVLAQFTQLHDGGDAYFQFAREVADGHFPPGDLFFDYQAPNIYPPLPPLIFGAFVWVFGGNVTLAYLWASLILPAALFLFFFWIGWLITDKNFRWALFSGFVGILTPIALAATESFFGFANFANIVVKPFYPGIKTLLPLLPFARVDHPLLTSLVFLPVIALFLLFWLKRDWRYATGAGFLSGLLFYTYFHIWVYWVVVLGAVFMATLLFLRKDKERLYGMLLLLGVVALVSIPYFVNYLSLQAVPGASDLIDRLGLEIGSEFRWNVWPHYAVYGAMAVLVYFFFWKNMALRSRAIFYWSVLAAAFAVWNVQMVLGYVPHSDHWPRGINFLIFAAGLDIFYQIAGAISRRWPVFQKFIGVSLVILMALLVTKKAVNAFHFINPSPEIVKEYLLPEEILQSWRWIENNLSGEPRVISPSLLTSIYLAGFTSARPYLPWGGVTPITDFEIEERFLNANKFFGVPSDILERRLRDGRGLECRFSDCGNIYARSNLRDARTYLYQLAFVDPENPRRRSIPEVKITELLGRYQKSQLNWQGVSAEYVFYGLWEREFSLIDLSKEKNLELIYDTKSVQIYKIRK